MADSGGNKPPDRESQSTSGKVDTKPKKAEITQQTTNAPSPTATRRSTADSPSGQESHSTSEVHTKPEEAERTEQTSNVSSPDPTVTGRSTADDPSGQGKDEHSKSAEGASGSLLNVPGENTRPKEQNKEHMETTGETSTLCTERIRSSKYVQYVKQEYEPKCNSEQRNQKQNEKKLTEKPNKLEIKTDLQKSLEPETIADKLDNEAKNPKAFTSDEKDFLKEQKLDKGFKDPQMTGAGDGQQAHTSHPDTCRETKVEDESIKTEVAGVSVPVSSNKSASMQIYVTKLDKEKITLDVGRNDSVKTIKAMIKNQSFMKGNWCLHFGKEKLEDENKTLAEYNIEPGSSLITLLLRKKGKQLESVEGRTKSEGQESKTGSNIQPGEAPAKGAVSITDNVPADDSDEEGEEHDKTFQNDFDESIGNPTKFTKELVQRKEILEGSDLELECVVSKPGLKAEWSKDGNLPEASAKITKVSEGVTHSLCIKEVSLKDSGEYSVSIDDVKSTSTVNIKERPVAFSLSLKDSVEAEIGKAVCLNCIVSKPDAEAKWTFDGKPVERSERIELWSSGMEHTLKIRNVLQEDSGEYSISIDDMKSTSTVNVKGVPSVPKKLDVCDITSGSCKLCWDKPENDGGSSLIKYIVNMKELNNEEWTTFTCVETEFMITNLKESTKYTFSVAARNNIGTGKFSTQKGIETKWSYRNEGSMTVKSGEPMLLEMKFKGQKPRVHCLFNGDEHPDKNRTSIQIEDDKIIFKLNNVVPCDKGKYMLTAENKTGSGVVITMLNVIEIEWKYVDENTVKVICGESMLLKMPFKGSKASVSLAHNGVQVQNKKRMKVEIKDSFVYVSLLEIDKSDQGKYTLTVENDTERGTLVTTLLVLEWPPVPQDVTANWTTPMSCQVKWKMPEDYSGSEIKEYTVEMYLKKGGKYIRASHWQCATTSLIIEDLDKRNEYYFRAVAINEVGTGEFTELRRLSTLKNFKGSANTYAESDSESIGSASDDDKYETNVVQDTSLEQSSLVQPPTQSISMDIVNQAMNDKKSKGTSENKPDNDEIELSVEFEQMHGGEGEELKKRRKSNLQNEKMDQKEDKQKVKSGPYFSNLNVNPALNGKLIFYAQSGVSKVGNKETTPSPDILLQGSGIAIDHAEIINRSGVVYINPNPNIKDILVNGKRIDSKIELHHNDRVYFAPDELYVFHDPQDGGVLKMDAPTFEIAQDEITRQSQLITAVAGARNDEKLNTDFEENIENTRTSKVRKVLGKKLKLPHIEEKNRKKFPNVKVNLQSMTGQNDVQIVLKGPKHDEESFLKFISYEYTCNEISFKDIVNGDTFENIAGLIEEHFGLLYTDEDDIVWDINEDYQRIGVCCSDVGKNDSVMAKAKKCIIEEKIGIGKGTEEENAILASKLNESLKEYSKPFICIKAGCQSGVVVLGLRKYIDEELEGIKVEYSKLTKKKNAVEYEEAILSQEQQAAEVHRTIQVTHSAVFNVLSNSAGLKRLVEKFEISLERKQNEKKQAFICHGNENQIIEFELQLHKLEREVVIMLLLVEVPDVSILNTLDERFHCIEREKPMKCDKLATIAIHQSGGQSHYREWTVGKHIVVLCSAPVEKNDHKLVVEFEESEGSCQQIEAGKTKVVPVPKWIDGKKKEKANVRMVFYQVLNDTSTETDMVFNVKKLHTWKMINFLKQLLFEVGETASEYSYPRCLSFYISEEFFEETCKVCESISTKHKEQAPSIQDVQDQENGVHVTIEKGNLTKTLADVLVNTISTDGNLSMGSISSSLLKATGEEMQNEIEKQMPIKTWKIYKTLNYKLNTCKYIFHGALGDYTKKNNQRRVCELQKFIFDCLKEASMLGCYSIALPAIGTGNLQYPNAVVGKAVFLAVRRFNATYSTSSSLRVLKCVLYSEQLCKAFRDEQKKDEGMFEAATNNLTLGHVALCAEKKSMVDVTEDYVLYLWERKIMHSAKILDHSLLKVLDKKCKDHWLEHRHGSAKNDPFMTSTTNLNCSNIVHVPCEDSLPEIKNALAIGILMVKSAKGKSLAVYFDAMHPFLKYGQKLMEAVVSTVTTSAPGVDYDLKVTFVTPGDQFKIAATFFRRNKQICQKGQQNPKGNIATLRLTGFEDDIEVAFQDIKSIKGLSILEATSGKVESTEIVAPCEQSISRDGADTNTGSGSFAMPMPVMSGTNAPYPANTQYLAGHTGYLQNNRNPGQYTDTGIDSFKEKSVKWSKNLLCEIPELSTYVYILNIPKDYNDVTIRGKIFTDECPITPGKLLYVEASGRALMICKSADDAQRLLALRCEPFQFTQKKLFVEVSGYFSSNVWKAAKMKNEEVNIKSDLQYAKVSLNEVTLEMKTITLYQLEYAKLIENRYATKFEVTANSEEESASFGFEEINQEINIRNVSQVLWQLLTSKFSDEFDDFERKVGKMTFHGETITIPIPKSSTGTAAFVIKLEKFVEQMKDKEIHEDPVDTNLDIVAAWCKEIDAEEKSVCVLNKEEKIVYIVCDTYEEVLKKKHQLAIKSGKVKATGIGRRGGGKQNKAEENVHTDTSLRHRQIYAAENMQEFQADGDIKVYVYKADILKLNVDCIVNAANENLQHGGGVAAVIAKAAGPSLTKEGDEYIRSNGMLSVGDACVTNPGRLQYKCVVHTVGPAWRYYKPYTLQDVKRCETDLYNAIMNSFYMAEKNGLKSIALPAISSAIFAVPKELCVHQYAKATFNYCRKAKGVQGVLHEIHFIDRDLDIVKKIQTEFQAFVEGKQNQYDSTLFVKHGHRHDRKTYSLNRNTNVGSDILPEPLTFEDGWKRNVFYFLDNYGDSILVCKGDVFSEKADAVVVPIDMTGRGGAMFASLTNKMPHEYHLLFKSSILKGIGHNPKLGDVAKYPGYSCGFPFVMCVIYPYEARTKTNSQRKSDLINAYTEIFEVAGREEKINSILTTMFGVDCSREDELQLCAYAFLESYLSYCKKKSVNKIGYGPVKVTVICQTDLAHATVFNALYAHVRGHKKGVEVQENIQNSPCGEDDVKDDYEKVGSLTQEEEKESCVICMDTLNIPKTLPCGHKFCRGCIDQHFSFKKQCPTCGKVCGIITGDQPFGRMTSNRYGSSLSGYAHVGHIAITYNFPDGKQGENHPKPGKLYKGIRRTAYLPDNEEGRKIHKMMEIAFERKLVFTIGNSRTTGQEGVITWNDIHHKTDFRPNSQFGYPDHTYLDRVKEELAAKGVTEADVEKDTI